MMAMMVMRTLHGLHLLLQCRERLLCFADVAGLQGIADLAQRLGKRTCVYQKPIPAHSGDEALQESGVNL